MAKNAWIVDGRGTKLLKFSKENNATVVYADPSAMAQKSINYGIARLELYSYNIFINHLDNYLLDDKTPFVLDEVENFFKRLHVNVIGFTQSED